MRNSEIKFIGGKDFAEILRAVVDKKAAFRFQAGGFSMAPFIKDGDVLTISPLPADSERIADVLAVMNPETKKLVVHRVVARKNNMVLLQGDNCSCCDGFTPMENILGRVTRVERKGKRVFWGFGPERYLIVLFNRIGLLYPFLILGRGLFGFWRKLR